MYRLKGTEGEETLKTEVKLMHLKNLSQKPPNCSNTNFSLHFKGVLKEVTNQTYSIFRSLYYYSLTKITTLIWLFADVKKPKKAWIDLKKQPE